MYIVHFLDYEFNTILYKFGLYDTHLIFTNVEVIIFYYCLIMRAMNIQHLFLISLHCVK